MPPFQLLVNWGNTTFDRRNYANRVAISNSRLVAIQGDQVLFSYKDYRDGGQWKTAEVHGVEYTRIFLPQLRGMPAPEQAEPDEPTRVCRKCKCPTLVLRAEKTRPTVDYLMRMPPDMEPESVDGELQLVLPLTGFL